MLRRSVLALVLIGACSPFSEATGASGPDAGTPTPVVPEGGTRPPKPVDGGSEGGSPSPCSTQHFFCDDFDHPSPLGEWLTSDRPAAPVQLDEQTYASPPRSVHVSVTAAPDTTDHPSYIHRFIPPMQRFRVELDLAIALSSPQPDGEVDVVGLELTPPDGFERYLLALVVKPNGQFVLEKEIRTLVNPDVGVVAIAAKTEGFSKVVLDVDLIHGKASAKMGAVQVQVDIAPTTSKGVDLQLGAAWANNKEGTYSVNFDNVVIERVEP
jgi:hypothetical protein